jgi:phospholysine phosphohistidine inorganic pyrophosphate phosphatase
MRALLIDLDGVIYQDEALVPGATETVTWLNTHAIPHAFVTNTTSRPRRALLEKLARFGVSASVEQIITPAVVASEWLRRKACIPAALFVPTATREDFADVPTLAEDAESGAGSVVVGDLGTAWTFAALNRAFRLLMAASDPVLVGLGATRYWRAADGLRLDVGPFVDALEFATGRHAVVLGKPARLFFETALDMLKCTAAETIMVGDDIAADVHGAQRAGMNGVLVRTGKFREMDLAGDIRPDAVLESFADLPGWWRTCPVGEVNSGKRG